MTLTVTSPLLMDHLESEFRRQHLPGVFNSPLRLRVACAKVPRALRELTINSDRAFAVVPGNVPISHASAPQDPSEQPSRRGGPTCRQALCVAQYCYCVSHSVMDC